MSEDGEVLSPPYRVDLGSVAKGTVVSQDSVEALVGVRYAEDPDRYRLLLLRVISWLQADLDSLPASDARRGAWVRERRRGIAVLDDTEAATALPDRFDQGVRHLARTLARTALVDRSKLSAADRERLDARERVMSRQMNASLEARRVETAAARKAIG